MAESYDPAAVHGEPPAEASAEGHVATSSASPGVPQNPAPTAPVASAGDAAAAAAAEGREMTEEEKRAERRANRKRKSGWEIGQTSAAPANPALGERLLSSADSQF